MSPTPTEGDLLASVDVTELHATRSDLMRERCPQFVEELEFGRFVRELLGSEQCAAVRIERHPTVDGSLSSHVSDVYRLIADFPLTLGVVGATFAPALAAMGAIAALVTDCTIEIERVGPPAGAGGSSQ